MLYTELLMNQEELLIDQDLLNQSMFMLEKQEHHKLELSQKNKESLN